MHTRILALAKRALLRVTMSFALLSVFVSASPTLAQGQGCPANIGCETTYQAFVEKCVLECCPDGDDECEARALIDAICTYFVRCHTGPAVPCEDLLEWAREHASRPLTPAEIDEIVACSGCSSISCTKNTTDAGPGPSPICDADGDSDVDCDDVMLNLERALYCYLIGSDENIHSLEEALATMLCKMMNPGTAEEDCNLASHMDCGKIAGCLVSLLGPELAQEVLCLLLSTCDDFESACGSTLCASSTGGCAPDPSGANCDADGNGVGGQCSDLQVLVTIANACACANDCSEAALAEALEDMICQFFAQTSATPPGCQTGSLSCAQVMVCLQSLSGLPDDPAFLCSVMACLPQCDDVCTKAAASTPPKEYDDSCLPDPASFDVCAGGSEAALDHLRAILQIAKCCCDDPSAADLVEWLCDLLSGASCRTDIDCEDLFALVEEIFGIVFSEEQKEELRTCTECAVGEVSDPRDSCADEKRDGKPNSCKTRERTVTPEAVGMVYGRKHEMAPDLQIAVPGRAPVVIVREYTSALACADSAMVGNNWRMAQMGFLKAVDTELHLYGANPSVKQIFTQTSGLWKTTGQTDWTIAEASTSIDGVSIGTWRLSMPGEGFVDYVRDTSSAGGAMNLQGLLLQEQSVYGRSDVYVYKRLGNDPTQVRLAEMRLSVTDLADTAATAVAKVKFLWHGSTAAGAIKGKLRRLEVHRPHSAGSVLTDAVDYLYFRSGANMHPDVGTDGDLVQVTHHELLNADAGRVEGVTLSPSITQYRYHHAGASIADPEVVTDKRAELAGGNHQIKAVIRPEQVEFYAQKVAPLLAQLPIQERVTAAAAKLRGLADLQTLPFQESGEDVCTLDLASHVTGYYPAGDTNWPGRVKAQFLQSSCGCSSGGVQSVKMEYTYADEVFTMSGVGSYHEHSIRVDERILTSAGLETYRTHYTDLVMRSGDAVPYVVAEATVEPGSGGRRWVRFYDYGPLSGSGSTLNLLQREFAPSACESYAAFDEVSPAESIFSRYDAKASAGLVNAYAYQGVYLTESRIGTGDTAVASCKLLTLWTYPTTNSSTGNERMWLPTRMKRFVVDTTTDSSTDADFEDTTYEYCFHNPSLDALAYVKTTVEAEEVGENGPGGTYSRYVLYDTSGRQTFAMDEQQVLTEREYASPDYTGAVVKVTQNADPDGLPEELCSLPSPTRLDDTEIVTEYTLDAQGRTTSRTSPGGVVAWTIRTMRASVARPGILYSTTISLPHQLPSSGFFDGPAHVTMMTAGGRAIQSSDYELDDTPYAPEDGVFTLLTELARATTTHGLGGLVYQTQRFHDVPANSSETPGIYEDSFTYDALGRVTAATNANGTVTERIYDVLDRVVEAKVGDGTTQVTVAEYFFDHTLSGTDPVQGVGDGNLTFVRQNDGTSNRDTVRVFDARNRLISTQRPLPPHEVLTYDPQDRVKTRSLYEELDSPLQVSKRGLHSATFYGQRGLVYRQVVATNPTEADDEELTFLETHRWFDAVGRAIQQWGPNAPATKRTYDANGRLTATFITDRAGDAAPGASGNHADADDCTGDHVLEEVRSRYNDAHRVDLVSTYRRRHDSTGTGVLAGGSEDPVVTFVAYGYDTAQRPIVTVNFGTRDSTDLFATGGSAPTWPPTPLPNRGTSGYENTIVEEAAYNSRGLIETTTDSEGRVTNTLFDDLSRRIAVIENFDDAAIGWVTTGIGSPRWSVTSGIGDSSDDSKDRVTSFVYDSSDQVVKQIAHLPDGSGESVQVTSYVYDQPATATPIKSHDLLAKVLYPGRANGAPGGDPTQSETQADFTVAYEYNRQGELTKVTDQNATTHTYSRDALGRVLADAGAKGSGSPIDDGIDSIVVGYDDLGRVTTVASKDGSTFKNGVKFAYTPLWQVANIRQDHDSEVDASGSVNDQQVAYTYDSSPLAGGSGGNFSRGATLEYPDGATVTSGYGSSGSIGDRVSRLTSTALGGYGTGNLAEYGYLGMGMTALVDYPQADIVLDRTFSPDGKRRPRGSESLTSNQTQSPGVYPGYDRFGRLRYHVWSHGDRAATDSSTPVPTMKAIVELDYTYDRASNRTAKYNRLPSCGQTGESEEYVYDGLDRLRTAKIGSGVRSAFTLAPASTRWELDQLGNWAEVRSDGNGDGDFSDTGELTQGRSHNGANEVTGVLPGGSTPAIPFRYDQAGNLKEIGSTTTPDEKYTHDLWNRLVKVQRRVGSTDVTVLENVYNGLHWRIIKKEDTLAADGDGATAPAGLDRSSVIYYSAAWQPLETRVNEDFTNTSGSPPPPTEDRRTQQFWGARYIDDAIMFRSKTRGSGQSDVDFAAAGYDEPRYQVTDAQFSVVAVVDADVDPARVVERVRYSPYGVASIEVLADYNHDGLISPDDLDAYITDYFSDPQPPCTDYNDDGFISPDDLDEYITAYYETTYPERGTLSRVGNEVGYCGYAFNASTIGMAEGGGLYTVRFRTYGPGFGRWLTRDPLDGSYDYQFGCPITGGDPMGLIPARDDQAKPVDENPINKCCLWVLSTTWEISPLRYALKGVSGGTRWVYRKAMGDANKGEDHDTKTLKKGCGGLEGRCGPDFYGKNERGKSAIDCACEASQAASEEMIRRALKEVDQAAVEFYGEGFLMQMIVAGAFQVNQVREFAKELKSCSCSGATRPATMGELGHISSRDFQSRQCARNLRPKSGYFDVIMHGEAGFAKHIDADGVPRRLDAKGLAELIRKNKDWKPGMPIRMAVCEAGKGGDKSLAAKLAAELKVRVDAPTDVLHVHPNGRCVIGPNKDINTGKWENFGLPK